MDFLPVYSGVNMQPQNSLSQMILKYAGEGKSLDWVNIYYPADAFRRWAPPCRNILPA